jgi:hypothetical protein
MDHQPFACQSGKSALTASEQVLYYSRTAVQESLAKKPLECSERGQQRIATEVKDQRGGPKPDPDGREIEDKTAKM